MQPAGVAACLNCFATFTHKGLLPTRPGQLTAAARAFEVQADIVAKAPPALHLTGRDEGPGDVDVGAIDVGLGQELVNVLQSVRTWKYARR